MKCEECANCDHYSVIDIDTGMCYAKDTWVHYNDNCEDFTPTEDKDEV